MTKKAKKRTIECYSRLYFYVQDGVRLKCVEEGETVREGLL
jgi:hypothetical protein